jgi:antitoxin CptB
MTADVLTKDGYIRGVNPAPHPNPLPACGERDSEATPRTGEGQCKPMQRQSLMSLASDIRRKRLLFRSWHRGTREADLLLGGFAEANLAGFDKARLDRYEALLECPDADLFDWIAGRATPPPEHDHDVTRLLLAFRYTPHAT